MNSMLHLYNINTLDNERAKSQKGNNKVASLDGMAEWILYPL